MHVRLENDELIYRSRFEVYQDGASESAFSMIVSELWSWIQRKEESRRRHNWKNICQVLSEAGQSEKFKNSGLAIPTGYRGGTSQDPYATALCVNSFTGVDGRRYWAMEYDEPDSRYMWRHWHTRVGLTANQENGTCLVNVYISYYDVQTYYGENAPEPTASVPNFVKNILKNKFKSHEDGYRARMGHINILTKPFYLKASSFDIAFTQSLLDPGRQIPLILIVTDWNGRPPVNDPEELADAVLGMANVYVLDWSDSKLREKSSELFQRGHASYSFRCFNDTLRIYQPQINLNDYYDSSRHQYFHKDRIESICEHDDAEHPNSSLYDELNRRLCLSVGRDERDVVDLNDLRRKNDQDRIKQNEALIRRSEQQLSELLQKMQRRKAEQEKAAASAPTTQDAAAQKRIETLENDIAVWEGLATAYDEEKTKLQTLVNQLQNENDSLKDDKEDLNGSLNSLNFRISTANSRADEAVKDKQELEKSSKELEKLCVSFADGLPDLLTMLEKLWGSKVVVLEEAKSSAEDFPGNRLDNRMEEYWEILKSVPTDLWDIYFGDDEFDSIDKEYQRRTGYELAITETGTTKADAGLVRQRQRTYNGRTIDITPHIKGKDKNPKTAFRLHYWADKENNQIVIGHCGGHLETSGTRRLH